MTVESLIWIIGSLGGIGIVAWIWWAIKWRP